MQPPAPRRRCAPLAVVRFPGQGGPGAREGPRPTSAPAGTCRRGVRFAGASRRGREAQLLVVRPPATIGTAGVPRRRYRWRAMPKDGSRGHHGSIPRWLPNAITAVRILLVPVWGVLAELSRQAFDTTGPEPYRTWSVVVLLLIGASDLVDGFLARSFALTSRTGATLDAVADKLVQVCLLTFFTLRGPPAYTAIPLWFLLLVFGRDL